MIRLLFLCLLLLPVAAALTEDTEGSADEPDDEDLSKTIVQEKNILLGNSIDTVVDRTTSEAEPSDHFTLIVIVVAVALVALSVAVIVAIVFVRRHMHNRQQGIYAVPTEQSLKGAV